MCICSWKLSYWTWFPKKLGGEKHYCTAELDEKSATERNNFGVVSERGKKQFLFVLLAPFLQKIRLDKPQIFVITKIKSNMPIFLIGLFVYITNHPDQKLPFLSQ